MTGHAKLRTALSIGLVLTVLCVIAALRVARVTRTSSMPAEPVAYAAPSPESTPASPDSLLRRVQAAASSNQREPQPDTVKPHEALSVQRVVTSEDFKRLPVYRWSNRGSGFGVYVTWHPDYAVISRRDLDLGGSLERAMGGSPGIVFRQTDPP
jgi:hypothetical protein